MPGESTRHHLYPGYGHGTISPGTLVMPSDNRVWNRNTASVNWAHQNFTKGTGHTPFTVLTGSYYWDTPLPRPGRARQRGY